MKVDILSGLCTYSTDKKVAANLEMISAERAREVIEMNKRGEKPLSLQRDEDVKPVKKPIDLLANDDISRFDKSKKRKKKKATNKKGGDGKQQQKRAPQNQPKPHQNQQPKAQQAQQKAPQNQPKAPQQ